MTVSIACRNRVIFATMILGVLGGIASIVLIVLGQTKIGGIMTLSLIPATVGCLEWRCRERNRPQRSLRGLSSVVTGNPKSSGSDSRLTVAEALPTSADIRINIAPNSPGSK